MEALANERDCEAGFEAKFKNDAALFFIVQQLIYLYLCLVLLKHWRNSDLPVDQGGLI